jgi:hypothetical protein
MGSWKKPGNHKKIYSAARSPSDSAVVNASALYGRFYLME